MNSLLMSSESHDESELKRLFNGFITETEDIVDENKLWEANKSVTSNNLYSKSPRITYNKLKQDDAQDCQTSQTFVKE